MEPVLFQDLFISILLGISFETADFKEFEGAKGFMYMTVQLDRCSICSYHVTKAYDRVGSFRIKKSRCSA